MNDCDIGIAIFMCTNLSLESKSDIPGAIIKKCPKCRKLMWLGPKKADLLKQFKKMKKEYFYGCFFCCWKFLKEKYVGGNFNREFH